MYLTYEGQSEAVQLVLIVYLQVKPQAVNGRHGGCFGRALAKMLGEYSTAHKGYLKA